MDFWHNDPTAYVELEGESRKTYLHPYLLRVLSTCKGDRILDYGCGDGDLLLSSSIGATEIGLYDTSRRMLDMAMARSSHRDDVRIIERIEEVSDGYYDAVVLSLVLMTVPNIAEQTHILSQVKRVKRENGLALIAVTHPCFRQYSFSTFSTEYSRGKEFPYLHDGAEFEVVLEDRETGDTVQLIDYHWSLSTTLNLIADCGLSIVRVIELPDKPARGSWHNANFPGYMVVHSR